MDPVKELIALVKDGNGTDENIMKMYELLTAIQNDVKQRFSDVLSHYDSFVHDIVLVAFEALSKAAIDYDLAHGANPEIYEMLRANIRVVAPEKEETT